MSMEKLVKEARLIFIVMLVIGFVLLGVGTTLSLLDVDIFNNKAIVALSMIPFSVALIYLGKMLGIRKYPQKLRSLIISETDERLVAIKNEVDAKALKITQAAVVFAYMGYTLMVPEDIFEAVGWWLLLILAFTSFAAQAIIGTSKKKAEEI